MLRYAMVLKLVGTLSRVGTLPKKFVRFLYIIGGEKISMWVTNKLLFASIGIILTSLKSIWNVDAMLATLRKYFIKKNY